jgi:DNA-directed RNA polymerase specialized sigma24 family protein
MSQSRAEPPTPEEALRLYRCHLEGDPTASNDLADAFLEPLIAWLTKTNPRCPPEVCEDAAADALLALLRNPQSFAPGRKSLEGYLRMSAQGDLRSLLARERNRALKQVPWEVVEHLPDGGKYLGRTDDPSLPLQVEEQARGAAEEEAAREREGWSAQEWEARKLMHAKEWRTAVFAQQCGLAHLPFREQQREVKRLKDRVKKREQRAGGTHDPA